jgi:hypothetical protein
MYKIDILIDYLTMCDHLIIFLENSAGGQCIPAKPAKYGIKIFAVIDVMASFTKHVQ